jgi:hypothetical protein
MRRPGRISTESAEHGSRRLSRAGVGALLGAASVAYAIPLVLLRGRPTLGGDPGVFLSVAGRLLQGDHLYRDVWDNKDPLFFYSDAAALWVGGWRAPFLLDILWVAVAAMAVVLLLDALGASAVVTAAGFIAYPLLVTGQWYYVGYSMQAALALAPLAAWLWARGSPLWAGVAVALGILFKVNLALVLLAAPLALYAGGVPAGPKVRSAVRFVVGLGGAIAFAAGLLAVRGELVPYLDMLRDNVSYANNVLVATGRKGGIHGHIRVIATSTRHAYPLTAVFLAAGIVAAWVAVRGRARLRAPLSVIAVLFLGVSAATAVTAALTVAWNNHVQMVSYPAALLVVFAVAALDEIIGPRVVRGAVQLASAAGAIVLLGAASFTGPGGPISMWFRQTHSRTAAALELVRMERLPRASNVSYAHLGQNDEEAHAAFIGDGWTLSCARFHQYPWTSPSTLSSILRCVETRRPQLLLITSTLSDRPGAPASWHRFVVDARALLRRDYERAYFLQHASGTISVWKRR